MTALGDFLEAIHTPCERYVTVRATIRHSQDKELAEASSQARSAIGRRKVPPANAKQPIRETSISVWARFPKHYRLERTDRRDDVTRERWEISDGDSTWECDLSGQVTVKQKKNDAVHAMSTDICRHFGGALLREIVTALVLETVGTTDTAGRPCVQLRGTPRSGDLLWPHWLPHGAESYDLHADLETGALLYIAGWKGDKIFEVNEVVEVAFDEPLEDALFRYVPSSGITIMPARPISERMSLATAIEKMPFTILVPRNGAELLGDVIHQPARSTEKHETAVLTYGGMWIIEGAHPNPDQDELEWEAVEHNGRMVRVSDPGEGGTVVASIEQEGTFVTIFFKGECSRLLDLATSLVPATA